MLVKRTQKRMQEHKESLNKALDDTLHGEDAKDVLESLKKEQLRLYESSLNSSYLLYDQFEKEDLDLLQRRSTLDHHACRLRYQFESLLGNLKEVEEEYKQLYKDEKQSRTQRVKEYEDLTLKHVDVLNLYARLYKNDEQGYKEAKASLVAPAFSLT